VGQIKVPHWAHLARDCDPWSEPESEWHLGWKKRFSSAQVEVPITKNGKTHRADVVLFDGRVVELQCSPISPAEISEREDFYGHMIWLFDVRDAVAAGRLDIRSRGQVATFRWKQPKKHIAFAHQQVYLDIGDGYIFRLGRIYPDAPCGGKGSFLNVKRLFGVAH
jgi:competence protein CoiA